MRMAMTTMSMEEIDDMKDEILEEVIESFYEEVDDVCKYKEIHDTLLTLSDSTHAQTFLNLAREELTHAETLHKVIDSLVTPEQKKTMLDNPFTLLHQKHVEKLNKMREKIHSMR